VDLFFFSLPNKPFFFLFGFCSRPGVGQGWEAAAALGWGFAPGHELAARKYSVNASVEKAA
jgi:hypothetical protein